MKKTIVLSLAFLVTTIFNYSSGKTIGETLKTGKPAPITTLIINANVTVVLVDNDKANLEVTGGSRLRDIITFKEMGDTLVIDATRNRNVKEAGIIYVPASQLKNIRINSDAHVMTFYPLQIPKLDVVINGACTAEIASTGELNMTGTKSYSFEQTTEVHRIPTSMLQKTGSYY